MGMVDDGGMESADAVVGRFAGAVGGLRRGSAYLVGVSGGADSVALLHLLVGAGFRKLAVCHLDHGLRGRAARGDAAWVRRLAMELGLAFHTRRVDVRVLGNREGVSLEEAGRLARHRFFAGVSREFRSRRVLLGHHADDRAETLLFNLMRGAGLPGLASPGRQSTIRVDGRRLDVLRPLLEIRKGELLGYLEANGLSYREDASNSDLSFSRNRIRHCVLPVLEREFGRDVRSALVRTARIVSDENDFLSSLVGLSPLPVEPSVRELRAMHPAIQRRLLMEWLCRAGVPDCGFAEVERVRSLLRFGGDAPAKINLPGGRHARRRSGLLFLE